MYLGLDPFGIMSIQQPTPRTRSIAEIPLPQDQMFDNGGRKGVFVEVPPPSGTLRIPETIRLVLTTTNVILAAPIAVEHSLVLTRGIGRFILWFSRPAHPRRFDIGF